MVCATLAIAMGAACGSKASPGGPGPDGPDAGGGGPGDAGAIDAGPIDAGPDTTGPVTVITLTTPALIVFRDGPAAPWQVPAASEVGRYPLDVHGPYTVEVVCTADPDPTFITIKELAQTLADAHQVQLPCSGPLVAHPPQVTGTMVQPGSVGLGTSYAGGGTSNWSVGLDPGDGTFDLVATPDTNDRTIDRVVIRRDLAIAGPATVTPIDLATQGVPLVPLPFTVSNLAAGEATSGSMSIETRAMGGLVIYQGPIAGVRALPGSALLPSDTQRAFASGALPPYSRGVIRVMTQGSSTTFAFPPRFDAVNLTDTSGKIVGTWSSVPAFETLFVRASGTRSDAHHIFHQLTLSAAYAHDTGVTTAALDTDVPGFKATWHIDLTLRYARETGVTTRNADAAFSYKTEEVNVPPPSLGASERPPHVLGLVTPPNPR